jgi:hypothetical protein
MIATSGAYQTSLSGDYDAFISKFSAAGKCLWSTYYGGKATDYSYAITLDKSKNSYITGYTRSDYGIATNNVHQIKLYSSSDVFVAKLSPSGQLEWGTYYGGSNEDEAYSIALDKDNNSYITGYTGSTNGISTSSVHQSTNGGYYDVFVAKFTSSGALSWGSYFGGKAEERGFSIALNKSNDIFITGNTLSASGIATEGTHQYKLKGGKDIFLTKFSNDGTRQWGTYYGGAKYDNAYNMVLDTAGNAYITGSTNSTSGIATDSSHQTVLNGAFDIVLAKFSATGKLAWGTYYGGYNDEEGYGITLDAFSNILITGATASSSEMATVDSYQDWFSGGVFDVIASKFSSEGKIQWGTYFGGYAFDYATDIEADKSGNIYILARTESDTNISSNGSHQGTYGGSSDISIIKFFDSTSAKCKPTQAGKDLSFCGISTPSQLGATPQSGHFFI